MHQFGSTSSLKKSKPYCKGFCKEKNVIELKKIKIKEQNSVPAIQQLGEEGPEVKELLTPPGTAEAITPELQHHSGFKPNSPPSMLTCVDRPARRYFCDGNRTAM